MGTKLILIGRLQQTTHTWSILNVGQRSATKFKFYRGRGPRVLVVGQQVTYWICLGHHCSVVAKQQLVMWFNTESNMPPDGSMSDNLALLAYLLGLHGKSITQVFAV